jgi:lipopolysaccharide export system permease protein
MRLLDRYLLRELMVPLFYCLAGFQIFWTAFDLFSNLKSYQDGGLGWLQIGKINLLRTPELLATVLPIALLLALLHAFTNLARHNELVAIRAAGVSLARISRPYFLVAILLGGALFVVTEYIAPNASAKSTRLLTTGDIKSNQWLNNLNFRDDEMGQIWHITEYNPTTGEMKKPVIEWTTTVARMQLFAQTGAWTNGMWAFYDVQLQTFEPPTNDLPFLLITNVLMGQLVGGSPKQLQAEIRIAELKKTEAAKTLKLSLTEIIEYRKLHPRMSTEKTAMLMTQFHGRIAQPWTCVVVVLMALPFGAMTGKRNVFTGVAGSVAICFFYFVLLRWGLALGTSGHIPPVVAAWLPNIVFAGTGMGILLKLR